MNFIIYNFLSILQIDFNIIQNLEQLIKYIQYKILEENIRNSKFSKIFSMEEPIKEPIKLNKEDFKKWLHEGEESSLKISDEQYTKLFQTINVKGDNQISNKELITFVFDPNYERDVQPKLDKMFPNTFSEDKMKKLFDDWDEIKKRPMTYREFKDSLRKLGCLLPLNDYERIFQRYCEEKQTKEHDGLRFRKRITLENFIKEAKRENTHTQELD